MDGTFAGFSSVTILDKLSYAGNIQNLVSIENRDFEFIHGDICDSALVDKLIGKNDVIINFAAESHVDRSIKDATNFIKSNIQGVQTLLDSIKKFDDRRFLQVSTDEVYGSIALGSADEEYGLFPNSPYAATKASADLLVRAYHKTFGLNLLVTRSSNNYGQNQYPEKLIPLFITNLMEGKKIPIYGNGENIRDWIHVDDNCEAIFCVLKDGEIGETYNIGGGNEISNINLTKSILELMGQGIDCLSYVEDRLGHDFRYSVNSSKVHSKIGFNPKISFSKGLSDTIKWYEDNQSWWKPLK